MLDFETVFLSRAQWEKQGQIFGLRSAHGWGGSAVFTPDSQELTLEEGKRWHKDHIVKGRYILWQEHARPTEAWDGHYMWLESLDDEDDHFKVDLKLESNGYDGGVEVFIYRVLNQTDFDRINEKGIFNFFRASICVHFIGPDEPVPALEDVPKYMVLFASNNKSRGLDGIVPFALFNDYEDAKQSCDGLNKAIELTEPGKRLSEDYDLARGDGKFIITDKYLNKRSPFLGGPSESKPQEFYIKQYEELKKLHS